MAETQEDIEIEGKEEIEQTAIEEKTSLAVVQSVEVIDETEKDIKATEEIEKVISDVRSQSPKEGEGSILEREQDAEVPAADIEVKSDDGADKQEEKLADEGEEKGGEAYEEHQQVESLTELVESSEVDVENVDQIVGSIENVDQITGVETSEQGERSEFEEITDSPKLFEREVSQYGMTAEEDEERLEDEGDVGGDEDRIKEREKEEEHILEEGEMIKETSKEVIEETASDRPESVIGVQLSQQEMLEGETALRPDYDRPEVKSPESSEMTEKETTVSEVEELVFAEAETTEAKREELISKYLDALLKREKLQLQNYTLQHKIAEHFRKRKTEEVSDSDKHVAEYQQRYLKYMAQIEDLRALEATKRMKYQGMIKGAEESCIQQESKADCEKKIFIEQKRNTALRSINSITGKPLPTKDIDDYLDNEERKELEVTHIRLENIKLKNKMKKREERLKLKEELAEGLHMIDFEQLKIENQTYNEKIEERNEELLKFRKKITSTVQILTHLKEKLQYVQAENLEQNNELKEVEASLAHARDILSRTKQARDALKIDNNKLRQKCGFLGNPSLLRDFEEHKDEVIELQTRLDQLKMKHADLTLQCNQVQHKVATGRQSLL